MLLEKIDSIKSWGYYFKNMHVGYRLNLNEFSSLKSNKECKIECLKENEVKEIIELEKNIFDLFHVTKEEYHAFLSSDNDFVLTLKENNQMIGFAIITDVTEKLCLLRNIGILKSYRGKKYGEQLLNKILLMARNKGCKNAFLWVDYLNEALFIYIIKLGSNWMRKKQKQYSFHHN